VKKTILQILLGAAICFIGNYLCLQSAILMASVIIGFSLASISQKIAPICTASVEAPDKLEPKE
jgi:hypothetical protein